jgi:hypothetical protein
VFLKLGKLTPQTARVSAFVSSRLKKSNFIIYQTKVPKSKIQNPKSKIKKSQAFLLRLGTFSSKD